MTLILEPFHCIFVRKNCFEIIFMLAISITYVTYKLIALCMVGSAFMFYSSENDLKRVLDSVR